MIILILELKVSPQNRLNVLKTLHSMIGPTNANSGCVHCEVYSSSRNDDDLVLLEKWKTKTDLEKYILSDEFHHIMAAMDNASEPPEISFNTVSSSEQMDLVEKVLG